MRRLLNLFGGRRTRLERDLHREIGYHVERRVADLVQQGVGPDEARRRAAAEFGGRAQTQESVRDAWVARWVADLVRDTSYAFRALVRTPAFSVTAVLSIAIGIGASAAIFSLVDQVLLRTLPVRDPQQLVLLNWNGTTLSSGLGSGNLLSSQFCRDLQAQEFFEGVFCRHPRDVNVTIDSQSDVVGAEIVSGSYFPVLGVSPALGRLIAPADDMQPGAHPVVVLSYDYWRARFDGAPGIVGRTLRINNFPMTVIGVAAPAFRGVDLGQVPALWFPESMKLEALPSWRSTLDDPRARWLHVFARLEPGRTADETTAALQPWFKQRIQVDMALEGFPVVSEQQRQAYLASTLTMVAAAQGRSDLRSTLEAPLRVLMIGTLLLHVLASLNVASLFLARGAGRRGEIQTRLALGASRGRIIGLLVADSLLIALAGTGVGLFVAPVVSHALLAFLPQDAYGVDLSSRIDIRVFGFALAATLVTTMLCGVALVWQSGRTPLVTTLRQRAGNTSTGVGLRKALVVGQMAFTLILLVSAGLFAGTLTRLYAKGPGFSTSNVLTFGIDPRQSGHTDEAASGLVREILATVEALPAVEETAIAGVDLLSGGSWNRGMTIAGATRITTDRAVLLNPVTDNFFDMMGIRLVAGRDFEPRDSHEPGSTGSFRSTIVNESFVRRYLGTENPIGRRVGFGTGPEAVTDIEIVGVVRDFAYRNLREDREQAFFPFLEDGGESGTFYVRMRGTSHDGFAAIRAAVRKVDPGLSLTAVRTLDTQMERSLMTERMLASLSGGFGAIALLLSVVGLYGVMSFVVTSRTREIGIRLALGATRASAVWHVMRDAIAMIAGGTAIALPCIWGLSRLVESQLFGVGALDARTIAGATALLAIVAMAGSMFPAWRAASVRPTEALRAE
jgi:predicted permease